MSRPSSVTCWACACTPSMIVGLGSGFESPYLERPGRHWQMHQRGLSETRLGCRDGSPPKRAPGDNTSRIKAARRPRQAQPCGTCTPCSCSSPSRGGGCMDSPWRRQSLQILLRRSWANVCAPAVLQVAVVPAAVMLADARAPQSLHLVVAMLADSRAPASTRPATGVRTAASPRVASVSPELAFPGARTPRGGRRRTQAARSRGGSAGEARRIWGRRARGQRAPPGASKAG